MSFNRYLLLLIGRYYDLIVAHVSFINNKKISLKGYRVSEFCSETPKILKIGEEIEFLKSTYHLSSKLASLRNSLYIYVL